MLKILAGFNLLFHTLQVYPRLCIGLKNSLLRYLIIQLFRWIKCFFLICNLVGSELSEGSLKSTKFTKLLDLKTTTVIVRKVGPHIESWGSYLCCLIIALLFGINNGSVPLCYYSPHISAVGSCPRSFTRERYWTGSQPVRVRKWESMGSGKFRCLAH